MRKILVNIIKAYQGISRFTSGRCRFYPTCSDYSASAIEKYGAIKGSALAVRRVSKCHPFNPGGYDPVP